MKRKTLTLTICFLAFISIFSIGFASWIISKPTNDQSSVGSITAETVKVEGYTINLEWQDLKEGESYPTIHFGMPESYTASTDDWLINNDGKVQSFKATLKITISNLENLENGVMLSLSALDKKLNDVSTAFGKAYNMGYISMPTVKVGSNEAVTYNVTNQIKVSPSDFTSNGANRSDGSCLVSIEFGWGNKVNNQNPLIYYNNQSFNEELSGEALNLLDAIYDISEEQTKYKVLVSPIKRDTVFAQIKNVNDESVNLEWLSLDSGVNNPIVHFGKSTTYFANNTDWFGFFDTVYESLSYSYKINVSDITKYNQGFKLSLQALDKELNDQSTALGKAIAAGYISLPKVKVGSNAEVDYNVANQIELEYDDFTINNEETNSASCTVVVTFSWGSEFNYQNPQEYYNNLSFNSTLESEAQNAVNAILEISNEKTIYSVIVQPNA